MNGDLQSFKLLVGQYGADVHARARGRFFLPEDCKDKIKQETNYDGEWSKDSLSSLCYFVIVLFFLEYPAETRCALSVKTVGFTSYLCHWYENNNDRFNNLQLLESLGFIGITFRIQSWFILL